MALVKQVWHLVYKYYLPKYINYIIHVYVITQGSSLFLHWSCNSGIYTVNSEINMNVIQNCHRSHPE